MIALLRDHDTERALLAALVSTPTLLRGVLTDERLMPQHFAVESHGEAFAAIVNIADRGEHPDALTVAAELERSSTVDDPKQFVFSLDYDNAAVSSVRSFARRIRDLHRRRELRIASALLSEAADLGDPAKLAEAEAILTTPADGEASTWTGGQLAERFAERMDQGIAESFPWPFSTLDDWTGGIRRKQVILIGGWTSNGKSVFFDQVLERLAERGLRCHSYINEMSEGERMDRTVARLSGVAFRKVHERRLDPAEDVRIRKCLTRVHVGLTECAGWSAQEIARHIRWNRWDVAGVDIVHEIEHHDERELAEVARLLRTTAKAADCVLVACVHLNDQRVTSPKRPVPVLRDVRGTGMLTRGADVVLFIHRDDNEEGIPEDTGLLFAAKIRNGQPAAMRVVFQPDRMRFLPRSEERV